jgi:predicted transcriptional regulator
MSVDLQATVMAVLSASGQSLTLSDISRGVTAHLDADIKVTLSKLAAKGRIRRRVGGRNHPWRYQVVDRE